MVLSDYITMAFAPEAIGPQALRKINGIKGHVLLVPERALSEEPAPGKQATLIASLPSRGLTIAPICPRPMSRPCRARPLRRAPPGRVPARWSGCWRRWRSW